MAEEWRPISRWEGLYEVSDLGRIRSFNCGSRWGNPGPAGRLLKTTPGKNGYPRVTLAAGGRREHRYVHDLVTESFRGSRPAGREVRHLDENPENNCLTNLVYGTSGENSADMLANHGHFRSAITHCPANHEYTPENTYHQPKGGGRVCRECARAARRAYKARQKARVDQACTTSRTVRPIRAS